MNAIEEMRERWKEQFGGAAKPLKGLDITSFRPTAFDAPRLPQSKIPGPKPKYDRPGRPPERGIPENITLKKTWEGWL